MGNRNIEKLNVTKIYDRGLTLDAIQEIFKRFCEWKHANELAFNTLGRRRSPIDALVTGFIKPTIVGKNSKPTIVSFVEFLATDPSFSDSDQFGKPRFGKVNVTICFSWSTDFELLVSAIEEFELSLSDKSPRFYFLDALCVNHFSPVDDIEKLEQLIKLTPETVMILHPWYSPTILKNVWVAYEYAICLISNKQVHLTFSRREKEKFLTEMVKNPSNTITKMNAVRFEDCKAKVNKDKQEISRLIRERLGGWEELNNAFKHHFQSTCLKELDMFSTKWPNKDHKRLFLKTGISFLMKRLQAKTMSFSSSLARKNYLSEKDLLSKWRDDLASIEDTKQQEDDAGIIKMMMRRGVKLEVLQGLARQYSKLRKRDANGKRFYPGDLLRDKIIRPATKLAQCAYADLATVPTGRCQIFISHAWNYSFIDVATAVKDFEEVTPSEKGSFYFLDYLAVNQCEDNSANGDDVRCMEEIIKQCDALLMIWGTDPTLTDRSWCVLEIATAIDHGKKIYVSSLNSGCPNVMKVDAAKSEARFLYDQVIIKKRICDELGGFNKVNKVVLQRVQNVMHSSKTE